MSMVWAPSWHCRNTSFGVLIPGWARLAKIQNGIDGVRKIRENLESSSTGFWGARDSDRHPQIMQTVQ